MRCGIVEREIQKTFRLHWIAVRVECRIKLEFPNGVQDNLVDDGVSRALREAISREGEMFQLDDKFLEEVGLGSLPDDQKKLFLDHFREQLELRVGLQLSEGRYFSAAAT